MLICDKIQKKHYIIKQKIIEYLCKKKGLLMENKETKQLVLIDENDKLQIDQIIDDLRKKYSTLKENNFDLTLFLKNNYDFEIVEAPLGDDTTGFIMVDDCNKLEFKNFPTHKIIVTNSSLFKFTDYLQKRRFILAHEFGHYVLHKEKDQIQFAKRDTEHFNTKEEQEAEYFARSLLMPKNEVTKIAIETNYSSISKLVEKIKSSFNVTENKARYRLQELGLI